MIDKQTLKKHNLKAVPFSCIGEGEWFLACPSYETSLIGHEFLRYSRQFIGDDVFLRDGQMSTLLRQAHNGTTVYVPVWRVTEVVL